MREYVSSVSPKGQITIPLALRKRLGIRPRDKVTFRLEGDVIQIAPAAFTWETAFASVPPLDPPRDLKEQSAIAWEEHARHVLDEMRER
jgi:AbrB family looped-hinge helix DNA binding protein